MSEPTEYELVTFEGRCICQSRELGSGYMGSGPLDGHVAQMRDPESWVHSSKAEWYRAGMEPYRRTLTLLSRFAVFMWMDLMARWVYDGNGHPGPGSRRAALHTAIERGLLRVTWSQP